MKNIWIYGIISFFILGCSHVSELSRSLWGSSTRALEEARIDAITRVYQCSYTECFDRVLEMAQLKEKSEAMIEDEKLEAKDTEEDEKPKVEYTYTETGMTVFLQDRTKSHIVLMNVPGSINTTEVGVFFLNFRKETKVEITSLSPYAKEKAAAIIFPILAQSFVELK